MEGFLSNLFTALIGAVIGYAFGATKVYVENFQDRKFSVLFGEEYAKYHEAITFLLLPEAEPHSGSSTPPSQQRGLVLERDFRKALEDRVKTYHARYGPHSENDVFARLDKARRAVDLYINKVENVVKDSQSWLVCVTCCTCCKPNGLSKMEEEKVIRVYFRYLNTVKKMYNVFYFDSDGEPRTSQSGPNDNQTIAFPECEKIYKLWEQKIQNSATQAGSTYAENDERRALLSTVDTRSCKYLNFCFCRF